MLPFLHAAQHPADTAGTSYTHTHTHTHTHTLLPPPCAQIKGVGGPVRDFGCDGTLFVV